MAAFDASIEGLRILVVDDEADSRELVIDPMCSLAFETAPAR